MPRDTGDGVLYITFVKVGVGDCILIRMPNGQTVMIDCGTLGPDPLPGTATIEGKIRGTVFDARWLKDYPFLDALILTHPDGDHHNKIKEVFEVLINDPLAPPSAKKPRKISTTQVKFKKVYTSAILGEHKMGSTSGYVRHVVTDRDLIKQLRFPVDSENKVLPPQCRTLTSFDNGKWDTGWKAIENLEDVPKPDFSTEEYAVLGKSGNMFIQILDGTHPSRKRKTGLYILASGVQSSTPQILRDSGFLNKGEKISTTSANSASIITLLIDGDDRHLFTADGTKYTEKFLIENFKEDFNEVDICQVPHHGSTTTSSSQLFVDNASPQEAVISSGTQVNSHNFPRGVVIDRYLNSRRIVSEEKKHTIKYWRAGDELMEGETKIPTDSASFTFVSKSIKEKLRSTGSEKSDINFVIPPK